VVRISAGSCQDLKNRNSLAKSGQGNSPNADAIFVGVRSCCLLPSHRNNLVEGLRNGQSLQHPKQISARAIVDAGRTILVQLRCIRTFRKMFSCLRRSPRKRQHGPCEYVINIEVVNSRAFELRVLTYLLGAYLPNS